jgi:hypothetical protein
MHIILNWTEELKAVCQLGSWSKADPVPTTLSFIDKPGLIT